MSCSCGLKISDQLPFFSQQFDSIEKISGPCATAHPVIFMTPQEYKSLRKKIGSQQIVADLLGVTRSLIGYRENDKARITNEAAIAIRFLAANSQMNA